MRSTYSTHFIKMAQLAHRKAMTYRRAGLPAEAYKYFAERDIQMGRAR